MSEHTDASRVAPVLAVDPSRSTPAPALTPSPARPVEQAETPEETHAAGRRDQERRDLLTIAAITSEVARLNAQQQPIVQKSVENIVARRKAEAEVARLTEENRSLIGAGQMLSNVAFNLAQSAKKVPDANDRASLDSTYKAWDALREKHIAASPTTKTESET